MQEEHEKARGGSEEWHGRGRALTRGEEGRGRLGREQRQLDRGGAGPGGNGPRAQGRCGLSPRKRGGQNEKGLEFEKMNSNLKFESGNCKEVQNSNLNLGRSQRFGKYKII